MLDEGTTVLYFQSIQERRPSSCAAGVLLRHTEFHSVQNLKGLECKVMLIKVSAVVQNANIGLLVQPQDMRIGGGGGAYKFKVTNFTCIQTIKLCCYVINQLLETSTLQNKF